MVDIHTQDITQFIDVHSLCPTELLPSLTHPIDALLLSTVHYTGPCSMGHNSTPSAPTPSLPKPPDTQQLNSLRDVQEDVRTTISWGDEAVALGPAEAFTDSFVDRTLRSPHRPDREVQGDSHRSSTRATTPLELLSQLSQEGLAGAHHEQSYTGFVFSPEPFTQ